MSDSTQTKTCPQCGRSVEPGFKFCDSCGHSLVTAEPPKPPIVPPPPPPKSDSTVDFSKPEKVDLPPETAPKPEIKEDRRPPLLQRLRERRQEKEAEKRPEFAPRYRPPQETMPKQIPAKPDAPKPDEPPKPPALEPPAPKLALEPPAPRPAFEPPSPKPVEPPLPPPARPPMERPAPAPPPIPVETAAPRPAASSTTTTEWRPIVREKEIEEKDGGFSPRVVLVWVLHLILAFAFGALLVAAAGGIASLVSNGRSALLEIRGLPIFIGGATAVIVFTLLRTGRVRETASRSVIATTVVIGFIVLVGAAAVLYRPPIMHNAQMRLDRALRVYGPSEKDAVDGFESDISDWNNELDHYRNDILAPVLGSKPDVNRFRFDASGSEETMKGIVDQMRTHADSSNNARLRDALNGLASIYDDQMSGINLITRGVINNDQTLIAQGDRRWKDGEKRNVEYFRLRLKPLLERAGLDVQSFENAVSP